MQVFYLIATTLLWVDMNSTIAETENLTSYHKHPEDKTESHAPTGLCCSEYHVEWMSQLYIYNAHNHPMK